VAASVDDVNFCFSISADGEPSSGDAASDGHVRSSEPKRQNACVQQKSG
jgi:hypothetical protein